MTNFERGVMTWCVALAVSASALACTNPGEQFPNSFEPVTSVDTSDPFEFPIGDIFIDARNTEFAAYVVTHAVNEDGSKGELLGSNQLLLGKFETFHVHLEKPQLSANRKIHVAVYLDEPLNQQWDPGDPQATAGGVPMEATIDVAFESSVKNPDSPYYHLSCAMKAVSERRLEHKTELDYDCRCSLPSVSPKGRTYNWDMDLLGEWSAMCGRGGTHEGNTFIMGEGPQLKTIQGRMTTGDTWEDRDEIIFGVKWGSLSAAVDPRFTIMAIDYYTGNRRVVSGEFKDPALGEYVVGEGPLGIPFVGQVRRGPDGMIYAMSANHRIVRVDPDTGDRELVWAREDEAFPQCDNGVQPEGHPDWRISDGRPGIIQLTVEGRGFTVAPDGSFYVPTLANGVPRPGYGVVRVAADGSSCEHVSRAPGEERNAYAEGIGTGFAFESGLETMVWHEGKLVAISVGADTYEIDPQTGDRVRLAGQGLTGSPNLPRVNRMFWDEGRDVFVLTGVLPPNGANLLTWNPDTQDTYAYFCLGVDEDNPLASECAAQPLATLATAALPGYLRPDGMIIHGFAAGGFLIYEMITGNNHWFAY